MQLEYETMLHMCKLEAGWQGYGTSQTLGTLWGVKTTGLGQDHYKVNSAWELDTIPEDRGKVSGLMIKPWELESL